MTLILEAGHSSKRPNNVSNFLMTQSVCLHVRIKSWNVLMCISMCPHFLKFQAFSYILENSHWHFHFLCRVGPFVGIFFLGVPLAFYFTLLVNMSPPTCSRYKTRTKKIRGLTGRRGRGRVQQGCQGRAARTPGRN